MNIFATHGSPRKCAKFLDNKRLNKMILETAQILCTAMQLNGVEDDRLYKPTHRYHPCVKWAANNSDNMIWLIKLFKAYCKEYTKRFNKTHATATKLWGIFATILCASGPDFSDGRDEFPNCARNKEKGIDFTHIKDVHRAYRLYLRERWKSDKIKPKWR